MPIIDDATGELTPRLITDVQASVLSALEEEFGKGIRNKADPIRKFAEAFFTTPLAQLEQEVLFLYSMADPRTAMGTYLDGNLWPMVTRRQASTAGGNVYGSLKALPTTPDPFFNSGQLIFTDGDGNTFNLNADVPLPQVLDSETTTGTASETIDGGGTNVRIAQKVVLGAGDFPAGFKLQADVVTGAPTWTIRLETDNSGEPSGTLANDNLVDTGVSLADGTFSFKNFTEGGVIDTAGTYWLVLIEEGNGTATFDGGAGGTADQVLIYTGGAWVASSNVENLRHELIEGFVFPVTSSQLGTIGNAEANAISSFTATNTTASTRFNTNVSTFENYDAFTGGRDTETDQQFRLRARVTKAARTTASVPGLTEYLLTIGAPLGIEAVDVVENDTTTWGSDDVLLDQSAATGTPGEELGTTATAVAMPFTTTEFYSPAYVDIVFTAAASLDYTVRIETDAAGSPSGTLAHADLNATASQSGAGTATVPFSPGGFLDAGSYWVVITQTGGTGTVDGESTSGDNLAQYESGGWNDSASDNLALRVYGGMPWRSIRPYIYGDTARDDDIARLIYEGRPATGYSYGQETGTTEDPTGASVDIHFNRATEVPVVFRVTVNVDSSFDGDEDTIRDLIVEHVGGTNSELNQFLGTGINKDVVWWDVGAAIVDDHDERTNGIVKIADDGLLLGRKSTYPTPGDLTVAQDVDVTAARGEIFLVEDRVNDIDVTLVVV